jgi:hypothetical protein
LQALIAPVETQLQGAVEARAQEAVTGGQAGRGRGVSAGGAWMFSTLRAAGRGQT